MNYVNANGGNIINDIAAATVASNAGDLFLPERIPVLTAAQFDEWAELDAMRQKLYSNLPKAQADLLWEVAIKQTPVAEIAEREGVSFQAIYLRLETARKNAKKFFKNP